MIFENRFELFNIDYNVEAKFIVNWNLDLEESPSFCHSFSSLLPQKTKCPREYLNFSTGKYVILMKFIPT